MVWRMGELPLVFHGVGSGLGMQKPKAELCLVVSRAG